MAGWQTTFLSLSRAAGLLYFSSPHRPGLSGKMGRESGGKQPFLFFFFQISFSSFLLLPSPLLSRSLTASELPAGSERFYALVVTGRFIRLEICTNQLSFSGSCQGVKLSGPAVRETPEGGPGEGGNRLGYI